MQFIALPLPPSFLPGMLLKITGDNRCGIMPDAGVRQHNIIIQKSSPGEYYTALTCGILPYVKQSLKDNNAPPAMHGFRGLEGAFCDAHTLS